MNLEQALEITLEYCWLHRPPFLKENHTIEEYKLRSMLEQGITAFFNRLVSVWGEDNITPKDIHLLLETLAISRHERRGFDDYFSHALIRK